MNDSSSKLLAALFAERRVLSVTEVTEHIKDTLESEFFALHVQGEVSNYKRHQSGHWYFTLKDARAQLREPARFGERDAAHHFGGFLLTAGFDLAPIVLGAPLAVRPVLHLIRALRLHRIPRPASDEACG